MSMRERLLQDRREALDKAKGILDRAEAKKRGLTDAEKAQHDACLGEVRRIDALFSANEAFEIEAARTIPVSQTTAMRVAQMTTSDYIASASQRAGGPTIERASSPSTDTRFGGFAFGDVFASAGRHGFASGGLFVPEGVHPSLWPALAPSSVAIAAGVRILPVADNTIIPSIASAPEAAWCGEDYEIPPTSTGLKGTKVFFKKLASRQVIENDLLRSADRDVTAMLLDEQARALALQLDRAIFEADGSSHSITGLRDRAGILGAAIDANGAAPADLDDFIAALTALEAANAKPNAWVMHPRTWGDLMALRDQTDSLRPLLGEAYGVSGTRGVSRKLLGLDVHLSSQLSITETQGSATAQCSSVYVGQWDQVILARDAQQDVYLDIDASERFSRDQSQLRALVRVDLVVPNPAAVYRLRGIKAAA